MEILISALGASVSILLMIIGFFLTRLVKQVDKTSESIDHFSEVLSNINLTIGRIELESKTRSDTFSEMLKLHNKEIEMLRDRTHDLSTYITAIKLQGELKNGWVFSKPWKLSGLTTIKDNE